MNMHRASEIFFERYNLHHCMHAFIEVHVVPMMFSNVLFILYGCLSLCIGFQCYSEYEFAWNRGREEHVYLFSAEDFQADILEFINTNFSSPPPLLQSFFLHRLPSRYSVDERLLEECPQIFLFSDLLISWYFTDLHGPSSSEALSFYARALTTHNESSPIHQQLTNRIWQVDKMMERVRRARFEARGVGRMSRGGGGERGLVPIPHLCLVLFMSPASAWPLLQSVQESVPPEFRHPSLLCAVVIWGEMPGGGEVEEEKVEVEEEEELTPGSLNFQLHSTTTMFNIHVSLVRLLPPTLPPPHLLYSHFLLQSPSLGLRIDHCSVLVFSHDVIQMPLPPSSSSILLPPVNLLLNLIRSEFRGNAPSYQFFHLGGPDVRLPASSSSSSSYYLSRSSSSSPSYLLPSIPTSGHFALHSISRRRLMKSSPDLFRRCLAGGEEECARAWVEVAVGEEGGVGGGAGGGGLVGLTGYDRCSDPTLPFSLRLCRGDESARFDWRDLVMGPVVPARPIPPEN